MTLVLLKILTLHKNREGCGDHNFVPLTAVKPPQPRVAELQTSIGGTYLPLGCKTLQIEPRLGLSCSNARL